MMCKISFRSVDRKLRSLVQPGSPSGYYLVRNYTHSPFKNSSDGATAFPWSRQNCPAGQGRWEHIHLTHKYVISLNRLFTKAPDDVQNLFPVEITFARPAPSSGHYLVRNYTHSPWSQAFQNFSAGANTSPRSRQDFLADQGRWGRTSGWWFRPSPPRWTAVCPSLWPSPPSRSLQPLWKKNSGFQFDSQAIAFHSWSSTIALNSKPQL